MAKRPEDTVPLLQGQDNSSTVTIQPRAPSTSISDFSPLCITVKALTVEKQLLRQCFCFYKSIQFSSSASALLIGNSKSTDQSAAGHGSDDKLKHVVSLKKHLTQLKVDVCECEPNFKGSHDDVNQLISQLFSKRSVSLFILYYSGPTNDDGDWEITTTTKYNEERRNLIHLNTITDKWKDRISAQSQLLIIVDADNSHKWVKKVRNFESRSNKVSKQDAGRRSLFIIKTSFVLYHVPRTGTKVCA